MVIHPRDAVLGSQLAGMLGIEAAAGNAEKILAPKLPASPAEQNLVHVLFAIRSSPSHEHFELIHPAVEELPVDGIVIGRGAKLGHVDVSHLFGVGREIGQARRSEPLSLGHGRQQKSQTHSHCQPCHLFQPPR